MTASPVTRSDAIAVVPTSLGSTGDAVHALAAQLQGVALRPPGIEAVGSAQCASSLAQAARLVEQAMQSCEQSLEQTARALHEASGAYGLADLVALGGSVGPVSPVGAAGPVPEGR